MPDVKCPTTFAVATWWLRKWRNKKSFDDPEFVPVRPWNFILEKAKEIDLAFKSGAGAVPLVKTEMRI